MACNGIVQVSASRCKGQNRAFLSKRCGRKRWESECLASRPMDGSWFWKVWKEAGSVPQNLNRKRFGWSDKLSSSLSVFYVCSGNHQVGVVWARFTRPNPVPVANEVNV